MHEALQGGAWLRDIVGGLSTLATWQFLLLWDIINDMHLTPDQLNARLWTPCPSGTYSSRSAYQRYLAGGIDFEPQNRLWRSWAPLRFKIFLWLAYWKRCWTADRLARRGLPHPDKCLLCDQQEETIDHLLISCVFVREVWYKVLSGVNLQAVAPTSQDHSFQEWWRRAGRRVSAEHRKAFNTLVMLVAWETWKHRNRCVFDGMAPSIQELLEVI